MYGGSRICLTIEELWLCPTCGILWLCWSITGLTNFKIDSAKCWDEDFSVIPIYLSSQLNVNWYTCEIGWVDELFSSFVTLCPLVVNLDINPVTGKVLATATFNLRLKSLLVMSPLYYSVTYNASLGTVWTVGLHSNDLLWTLMNFSGYSLAISVFSRNWYFWIQYIWCSTSTCSVEQRFN